MNVPRYFAAVAIGIVFSSAGCQTSSERIATYDRTRGAVALQTTSDQRSAMQALANDSTIQQTEIELRKALQQTPNDLDIVINLAKLQVAQNKLDDATKACQHALRHDLQNKEARKVLAQIAIRRGQYDKASIFLGSLGGATQKDSTILNMQALIELERGDNSAAMALFKQAIKVNPNDLAARMNIGVLLLKYRQLGPAAVQFERVVQVMPSHRDAKLHLAIAKAAQGQVGKSRSLLEDVLAHDEQNPLALYNLAVVEGQTKDYDDALDRLKVYLKSPRGNAKDSNQVFALVDSIQKRQASEGEAVSDQDIQAMAAAMEGYQPSAPKTKVARAPAAKSQSAKSTQQPSTATEFVIPMDNANYEEADVGDLERALMQ